ncbi:MAG: glucosamine-6-phosphate deaminase [Brevinema sp.]
MDVRFFKNRQEIVEESSRFLANEISSTKNFVLGLGTGATVLSVCEDLVTICQKEKISLKHVVVFHAGEYVGISHRDPSSYRSLMEDRFFSKVDIPKENIHYLNGESVDLSAECEAYEASIKQYGGLDLFFGSLGENGNLAFNEPGSALHSRTRLKTLSQETIQADARFFHNNIALVPTQVLTIGLQTIYEAKKVLIAAYGVNKAFAVQECLEHPVGAAAPGSMLQLHPEVSFYVDPVAGRYLDEIWRLQQVADGVKVL